METFNFRNPDPGEVRDVQQKRDAIIANKTKYQILGELLAGNKDVDITRSSVIYEAINKEKMDFEEILKLHPKEVKETIEQVKEDRTHFDEGRYWNNKSKARWGLKGHIPTCVYYARPKEYWKDEKLVNNFFNLFPAFRIGWKDL